MHQTPNQIKKEESQMFLALVLVILVLMAFQVFNRQPASIQASESAETIQQPPEV